ncbi:MAG: hypothetical protein LUC83_01885 [Clostridiales bacterium]|nr:hypothetical protein [Clostridiales bacterium]
MAGKREKRSVRTRRRGICCAVAAVAAVLVISALQGNGLFAKYTTGQTNNEKAEAAAFYFGSNLLKEESDGATYTYPADETDISFTIYNYEDDLRYSECDITYEVTLTGATTSGASVSQTLSNASITGVITASGDTASLDGNQKSTHTITFSNLSAGTYTITATAISPYSSSLTATFTLTETSNEIIVDVGDNSGSAYVDVTVTVSKAGNVTITWPSGVVPDTTDSIFDGVTITPVDKTNSFGGGSATIEFENDSSYTFRFLKQYITTEYTSGDTSTDFLATYKND